MGRPGYANLVIDNLAFCISHSDLLGLAEDLTRLLIQLQKEQRAREDA
jgi:hypothetical protein